MTVDQRPKGIGHPKSIGRWVAGFIAVLVVGLLGSTAFGSLAHAASTASSDGPVATAQSDRELRSAIGTLTGEAHVTWPDTFGWVWLKPADNPRKPGDPEEGIFVGFSEGAEAKVAELAEDFIRPDLLVAVTVKHSMKEIDEILHMIGIDRDRAKQGLPPLGQVFQRGFDLDSDIPNGKIIVAMPNITKKIKNAFRKEYGPDGIRFKFIDRGLSGLAGAGARLKKVNRKLRQITKRFKRAKVKYRKTKRRSTAQGTAVRRSYRQARRLKRRVVKQRQQRRKLVRKIRRTAVGSLAHVAGGDGPVAKAQVDWELDAAISALRATAYDTWPNEYGGTWFTPTPPQQGGDPEDGIFVGFSEGAEEKVAVLAADFPRPELLVAVTVKYSEKELFEFQQRISADKREAKKGLPPLGHATDGWFAMDIDVKAGEVLVLMPLITKRIRSAFNAEYGSEDIDIRFIKAKGGLAAGETKTKLKKVNRNLRQTRKRFKRAKVKRSYRQARKLKRRFVTQRQRKQMLRRKMYGLPWPVQRELPAWTLQRKDM